MGHWLSKQTILSMIDRVKSPEDYTFTILNNDHIWEELKPSYIVIESDENNYCIVKCKCCGITGCGKLVDNYEPKRYSVTLNNKDTAQLNCSECCIRDILE